MQGQFSRTELTVIGVLLLAVLFGVGLEVAGAFGWL